MADKIMAAMSGGVDSSAAALILKDKYSVCGGTLKLCDDAPAAEAKKVCDFLGIEHHVFDFKAQFKEYVIDDFARSYMSGLTPNPCIICNNKIKFGLLLDAAEKLGCNKIATGHYANVEYDDLSGRYLLKKASDPSKDQTYVLYGLSQRVLSKIIFPLSQLSKDEIREIARGGGLPAAEKKDSQDICFIPDKDYIRFLKDNYGAAENRGDFVLKDGTVLGEHKGQFAYTIGQRKGLGVSYSEPLYVIRKDDKENRVVLGRDADLYKKRIKVKNVNWIAFDNPQEPISAEGKIRYSQKTAKCRVYPTGDNTAEVEFENAQRAPTAGQSAVFYSGDVVLGGGIIE